MSKLMRYFLTGGTAAAVDVIGFRLLLLLRLPIGASAVASWLIAAIVNYSLTSRFVFNRVASGRRAIRFFVGALLGLGVNASVTLGCATQLDIDPLLSKLVGIGIAFALNYLLNLLWVFK